MPPIRDSIGRRLAVAALVVTVAVLGAASPDAAPAGQTDARTAPQGAVPAADYVGEDTCLSCHDTKSYKGTAHALTTNPRTPAATHGCESCHGPGKAHVDSGGDTSKIVNPLNLTLQEASERCLTCHDRGAHPLLADRQHDPRGAGCLTCHKVHVAKGEKRIALAARGL